MDSTQYFAFVLNGEEIWAHWVVVYLKTSGMMSSTKTTFGLIVAMVKVELKSKFIVEPLLKLSFP
jgi:hypothetical protein